MTKLLAQALALTDAERAELAHELLESLAPPNALSDEEPAFRAELERRADEVRAGDADGMSIDEVFPTG